MDDFNVQASTLLKKSSARLLLSDQHIPGVKQDIERFFKQKTMEQVQTIDFENLNYALAWHSLLERTGLTDKRPNSKIGVLFDMIIDRYQDSMHLVLKHNPNFPFDKNSQQLINAHTPNAPQLEETSLEQTPFN